MTDYIQQISDIRYQQYCCNPLCCGLQRRRAMDQLSRELELSMFLGIHMKNNARVEVRWSRYYVPIIADECNVEYDGDDEEYTGTVVGLREGQVSVRYAESVVDGVTHPTQTCWEDIDRLREPHNVDHWAAANLTFCEGEDPWKLVYDDGDQFAVVFNTADQLQHPGSIPQHWNFLGDGAPPAKPPGSLQTPPDVVGPAYAVFDYALDKAIESMEGQVDGMRVVELEHIRDDFHRMLGEFFNPYDEVTAAHVDAMRKKRLQSACYFLGFGFWV